MNQESGGEGMSPRKQQVFEHLSLIARKDLLDPHNKEAGEQVVREVKTVLQAVQRVGKIYNFGNSQHIEPYSMLFGVDGEAKFYRDQIATVIRWDMGAQGQTLSQEQAKELRDQGSKYLATIIEGTLEFNGSEAVKAYVRKTFVKNSSSPEISIQGFVRHSMAHIYILYRYNFPKYSGQELNANTSATSSISLRRVRSQEREGVSAASLGFAPGDAEILGAIATGKSQAAIAREYGMEITAVDAIWQRFQQIAEQFEEEEPIEDDMQGGQISEKDGKLLPVEQIFQLISQEYSEEALGNSVLTKEAIILLNRFGYFMPERTTSDLIEALRVSNSPWTLIQGRLQNAEVLEEEKNMSPSQLIVRVNKAVDEHGFQGRLDTVFAPRTLPELANVVDKYLTDDPDCLLTLNMPTEDRDTINAIVHEWQGHKDRLSLNRINGIKYSFEDQRLMRNLLEQSIRRLRSGRFSPLVLSYLQVRKFLAENPTAQLTEDDRKACELAERLLQEGKLTRKALNDGIGSSSGLNYPFDMLSGRLRGNMFPSPFVSAIAYLHDRAPVPPERNSKSKRDSYVLWNLAELIRNWGYEPTDAYVIGAGYQLMANELKIPENKWISTDEDMQAFIVEVRGEYEKFFQQYPESTLFNYLRGVYPLPLKENWLYRLNEPLKLQQFASLFASIKDAKDRLRYAVVGLIMALDDFNDERKQAAYGRREERKRKYSRRRN